MGSEGGGREGNRREEGGGGGERELREKRIYDTIRKEGYDAVEVKNKVIKHLDVSNVSFILESKTDKTFP